MNILKSLLTSSKSNSSGPAQTEAATASQRRYTIERISNGLVVTPGMGIQRYCKNADEVVEYIGAELRKAFPL